MKRFNASFPGTGWMMKSAFRLLCVLICVLAGANPAAAQLNENCVVSVLNRNVTVNPDGSWVLPNIPANFGPVRARATCVQNGVTTSGQSDFFTLPTNGNIDVPAIALGNSTPIPVALTITTPSPTLTSAGASTQLAVSATFNDGQAADLTSSATGTVYTISNNLIATITPDGLVTAVHTGTVLVQATNEGKQALIAIHVLFGGGVDSDGDGIPDDYEIAHGMNPNDPTDAQLDFDHDGLTNLQEFLLGTDPNNPDTDGDGLSDGDEVNIFHTNPLVADTDGDGIPDGLEVLLGTDPLDPNSVDYARALSSIEISPASFVLTVDSILGTASVQLSVIGHLIDGHTVDLTSTARHTNYSTSDINVCNFGSPDGRVFAGVNGACTITATSSGFSASATGTVQSFTPTQRSFVPIPGLANSVAVSGDFAFVAAGSAGLQVVHVSPDRTSAQIISSLSITGNANDVKVVGNTAYIAMGNAGLAVVDVTNPLTPQLLGAVSLGNGIAMDVEVRGNLAFCREYF